MGDGMPEHPEMPHVTKRQDTSWQEHPACAHCPQLSPHCTLVPACALTIPHNTLH